MPRSLDPTVQSAFKLVKPKATQPVTKKVSHVVSSIKTKDYYACRSCLTKYSYHAGRMKEHLIGCKEYLTAQTTPNAITRIADARRPTNQTQIIVPTLSSTMKKALDLDAARVCYEEGLPFTLFEKPAMQRFLLRLNPAYKPPSRKQIASPLLEEAHFQLKESIDKAIRALDLLNIVTDESSNINKDRIANISVHTDFGSIHWLSECLGTMQSTSFNIATWLRDHLQTICNGEWERVNSIVTDTCSSMLKSWEILATFPELKHCFFVPCDSHGLQLLMGDLLKIPSFKALLAQAQTIVVAFRKSPLQLARLRQYQIEIYGEARSLCLAVMTRWGTQFRLVHSVLKSKDVLRRFAFEHPTIELPDNAMNLITSKTLWADLEPMRELLQPLDEAIKMSESDGARLGTVCTRWDAIDSHLKRMQAQFPEIVEFLKPNGVASIRFERQIHSIHIAAFYLSPQQRSAPLNEEAEKVLFDFFRRYSKSKENEMILRTEYLHYRLQKGVFGPLRTCWEYVDEPLEFWMIQMSHTKFLGQLAYRIHSTPANSVSSERAFSTQNYIHTKDRNSLHVKRVDKLIYAYINSRILERIDAGTGSLPSPYKLSEADEVELELRLLESEDLNEEVDSCDEDDEHILMEDFSIMATD